MKAIETVGSVDERGRLVLKERIPFSSTDEVRVIVLAPEEDEVSEAKWLKSAVENEAFRFLNGPSEDIYTLSDGKPFHDPA